LTNQVNNRGLIPSTDVIQLTLILKMTTSQVIETSVIVYNNSPIQDYVQPDGGSNPQVAGRRSQVAGHRSRVAGHGSQVAGHRSRIIYVNSL